MRKIKNQKVRNSLSVFLLYLSVVILILFFCLSGVQAQSFFTGQKIDSVTSLSGQTTRSINLDNQVGIKSVTVINRDTNTILVSFGDSTQFAPVFANERATFPNTSSGTITIKGVASKIYIFTRYGIGPGINYIAPVLPKNNTVIDTNRLAYKDKSNSFTSGNFFYDSFYVNTSKRNIARTDTINNFTSDNNFAKDVNITGRADVDSIKNSVSIGLFAPFINLRGITSAYDSLRIFDVGRFTYYYKIYKDSINSTLVIDEHNSTSDNIRLGIGTSGTQYTYIGGIIGSSGLQLAMNQSSGRASVINWYSSALYSDLDLGSNRTIRLRLQADGEIIGGSSLTDNGSYNFQINGTGFFSSRLTIPTLTITTLPTYADEDAAIVGGLTTGMFYRTSTGEIRIKL